MYNMKIFKRWAVFIALTIFNANLNASEPNPVDSLNLNEVLVISSSRLGAKIQSFPASVSVLRSDNIYEMDIYSLPDISVFIPNLIIHNYGSKLTSPIYLRGIGSKLGNSTVGMYVDNVPYYAKALMNTELYDINNIEVLRGPQGTEYGRNTMGGLININSLSPKDYQGVKLKLQSASYSEYMGTIGVYTGYKDLKASVNGYYLYRDGFFNNKFTNKTADDIKAWGLRNRLIYDVTSNFNLENIFNLAKSNQGSNPYAIYDSKSKKISDINYNDPSRYNNFTVSDAFIMNYDNASGNSIRSITTYQYYNDKYLLDQDFTPKTLVKAQQNTSQYDITQDLSLHIKRENMNMILGYYGFFEQSHKDIFADVRVRHLKTYKDYKSTNYGSSLFGKVTFDNVLLPRLSVTAGARLDIETAYLDYINSINKPINELSPIKKLYSPLFIELMPRLAVGYSFSHHNTYVSISRGYQTGGFNTSYDKDENITYQPEYSWNYEVGLKSNWFSGFLHTDLSLFYIDWRDQHIYKLLPIGSMTTNAGHSFSRGAEVSVSLHPIGGFSLVGSYGYTDARFINNNTSKKANYDNNRIPYVPNHTASLLVKQSFNINYLGIDKVAFSLIGKGAGKTYFDEANTMYQDFYTTFDASVSMQFASRFNLRLWGHNLTNAKYTSYQFRFLKNNLAQAGRPMQIGATLEINL